MASRYGSNMKFSSFVSEISQASKSLTANNSIHTCKNHLRNGFTNELLDRLPDLIELLKKCQGEVPLDAEMVDKLRDLTPLAAELSLALENVLGFSEAQWWIDHYNNQSTETMN